MAAAEALGFRVRELEGTHLEEARFAGPDDVRARDLVCALTELDADLVMAMRGGYGCHAHSGPARLGENRRLEDALRGLFLT